MVKLFFKVIFFLLSSTSIIVVAQQKNYPDISPPLKLPITLAGTFCELRNSHFHGGIDLRTNGEVGHKIYAVETGFVSRIRISGSGYGNALYIDHPNGYTSVYGHLLTLNDTLNQWIRKVQFALQKNEIDTLVPPYLLTVARGEWVAVSGNSGASQAPHLHFEMRETKTEATINPLLFGLKLIDNIKPYATQVAFQSFDKLDEVSNIPKRKLLPKSGFYGLALDTLKVNAQKIGLSFYADDKMEGSDNSNGIYEFHVHENGSCISHVAFNEVSCFDDIRKIPGHMEHRLYRDSGLRFHRTYKMPGFYVPIYDSLKNNGLIFLEKNEIKKVNILFNDFNKNTTQIQFYLKHDSTATFFTTQKKVFQKKLTYKKPHHFHLQGAHVYFHDSTFYDDAYFTFTSEEPFAIAKVFSKVYVLQNDMDICQRAFDIKIQAPNFSEQLKNKAIIMRENSKGNRAPLIGTWSNDTLIASSKEFGKFYISIDTTKPAINPVNIYNNKLLKYDKNIRFTIGDNLTGVTEFDMFIDGQWVLCEYDSKTNVVKHNLGKIEQGSHELVFVVVDKMNNEARYKIKFRK